jgi:hypothetical protein
MYKNIKPSRKKKSGRMVQTRYVVQVREGAMTIRPLSRDEAF